MLTAPSPLDVCTPELLPDVERFSGKFGPLENLRRRPEFAQRILPIEYVMPGETFQGDSAFDHPFVRAGHPIDIRDMVGVLETLPAASKSNADVNRIVDHVRRQASRREVISFANFTANSDVYYNPDDVIIGIQPYVPGLRASILRHPNRHPGDDEFVISWFRTALLKSSDELASGLNILSASFDERSRLRHTLGDTLGTHPQLKGNMSPEKLIETYLSVERTGLMRDDRVFMMEAVGDERHSDVDPYICQLRDFKERKTARWRIDEQGSPYEMPKLVFGVTPEEGIPLTVVHSPDCLDANGQPLASLETPWALLKTQHKNEPPLMFQPRNMAAYLPGFSFGSGMASLAHMQERLAAQADITVFENTRALGPSEMRPYDFSQHMIAAMLPDDAFTEFQRREFGKLSSVRSATSLAVHNTLYQGPMLDFLEQARACQMDIVLKSDGYTASIRATRTA